ncbi:hypothetical protein ACP70R_049033 [Stipagrostis hirtigluma subsp. patula]
MAAAIPRQFVGTCMRPRFTTCHGSPGTRLAQNCPTASVKLSCIGADDSRTLQDFQVVPAASTWWVLNVRLTVNKKVLWRATGPQDKAE